MTFCERYRYALTGLSIENTPTQDFVQLYRAGASTRFTSAFDHTVVHVLFITDTKTQICLQFFYENWYATAI
jgi:hypothetical protein